MSSENNRPWVPFRPNAADLTAIGEDVSDVRGIQQTLLERNKHIHCPDRVAHQYQSILAAEMGANPGNWVHDPQNSIKEPATVFGVARKIAYQRSQTGRGALDPAWQDEKDRIGHMSAAR